MQRFFKNKRPKIPPLNCATGTAVTDQQKANLLATNIKNNFVENEREDDNYNQNDELINTTVNNFLSTPPNSFIEPALPDEIITILNMSMPKRPLPPGQPIGVNVPCTLHPIREQPLSSQPSQKTLKTLHPDKEPKPRLLDSIARPITNMPHSRMENTTFVKPSIIDFHGRPRVYAFTNFRLPLRQDSSSRFRQEQS
ncbi:hypothetical protein TNCV_4779761 [Trichonephila clavipes]|nr:hypothetical protein TNCV_4779761 [Trichonephila clavipes]